MNPELFSKFTLSDHKTVTVFLRTLSQQKHVVFQSTVPLQLKRFKVGSKMAIAASAPVLPNQKKTVLQIARFTDVLCISESKAQFPCNFISLYNHRIQSKETIGGVTRIRLCRIGMGTCLFWFLLLCNYVILLASINVNSK